MKTGKDIFFEMPCLTEKSASLSGLSLQKKWFKKVDKRYLAEALQKFIDYNKTYFKFLEISPSITGSGRRVHINFKSSRFVGSIPLRAPDTGKQIGDFVVKPRFTSTQDSSEYIEIINLIEKEISPEFKDSIPLASGENIKPPLYLEALKYIKLRICLAHAVLF